MLKTKVLQIMLLAILVASCSKINPIWDYKYHNSPQFILDGSQIAYYSSTGEYSRNDYPPSALFFFDLQSHTKEKVLEYPGLTSNFLISNDTSLLVFVPINEFSGDWEDLNILPLHREGLNYSYYFENGIESYWIGQNGNHVYANGAYDLVRGLYVMYPPQHSIELVYERYMSSPTVSMNEDYVAYRTYRSLEIIKLAGEERTTIEAQAIYPESSVEKVLFSPLENLLVTLSLDEIQVGRMILSTITIHDTTAIKTIYEGDGKNFREMKISDDGEKIFVRGSTWMLSVKTDGSENHRFDLPGISYSFDISPDGEQIVVNCSSSGLRNHIHLIQWDGSASELIIK